MKDPIDVQEEVKRIANITDIPITTRALKSPSRAFYTPLRRHLEFATFPV